MTALVDFIARLNEVKALLQYIAPEVNFENNVPLATSHKRPFSDSTLARSCTVLMVSYFEGYIKDLSDESFDFLLEGQVPCSSVDSHFRGYVISEHLDHLRTGRGPKKDWEAMSAVMEMSLILSSQRAVEEKFLPREQTKRAVTSIEPKKINELFRVFGDVDINGGPMSKFGERLLSLKNIRDNAVHGNEADLTPISLRDALTWAELLEDCATEMTARMSILLSAICSPNIVITTE